MKLSEITLETVKDYLRIDHNLDDKRLEMHMNASLSYILKANGQDKLTQEFEESNEFLTDIYFCYLQHLYDYGKVPDSKYINSLLTIDWRFDD